MARVLNWVPTNYSTYHEAGAGERQTQARSKHAGNKTTIKLEFGRGIGRSAGLYRAYERQADPRWREREDRQEEAREEAKEAARTAAHRAAAEARRRQHEGGQPRADQGQRTGQDQGAEPGSHRAGGSEHSRRGQEADGSDPDASREERRRRGQEQRQPLLDFDTMRQGSWEQYEEAFVRFKEHVMRGGAFRVANVPLPPKGMVVEPAESAEVWHKNLLKASLRWHPDKWSRFACLLTDPSEVERLKLLTEGMFRSVTRAKSRGYGFTRFPARSAGMWREEAE